MALVTGGCGYIGSHTVLQLLGSGHDVVVVDDFSNASGGRAAAGGAAARPIPVHRFTLEDRAATRALFAAERIDAVIHFAGFKAVGESVAKPLDYYRNNIGFDAFAGRGDDRARRTVLGVPPRRPCTGWPQSLLPGGAADAGDEPVRLDQGDDRADPPRCGGLGRVMADRVAALLQPRGRAPSGRIGEDPTGVPNNLLPFIAQVAVGRREKLAVFGGTTRRSTARACATKVSTSTTWPRATSPRWTPLRGSTGRSRRGTWGRARGPRCCSCWRRSSGRAGASVRCRTRACAGDVAASFADPALAERESGLAGHPDPGRHLRLVVEMAVGQPETASPVERSAVPGDDHYRPDRGIRRPDRGAFIAARNRTGATGGPRRGVGALREARSAKSTRGSVAEGDAAVSRRARRSAGRRGRPGPRSCIGPRGSGGRRTR